MQAPGPSGQPGWSASQEFVFVRTYAAWREAERRRETWLEAVGRYFEFFEERFGPRVPATVWDLARASVVDLEVMPSMRALWSAGAPLANNHILAYNCCSLVLGDLERCAELMFILLSGAGVGYSVEQRYLARMPEVAATGGGDTLDHRVHDSPAGWAQSVAVGLRAWFGGGRVRFDYGAMRPAGTWLGGAGWACGAPVLEQLHARLEAIVRGFRGRPLSPLAWSDLCTTIAQAAARGGARRAALIAFSDLDDEALCYAKHPPFAPHRALANHTAVYRGRPSAERFQREWDALVRSRSGERGIFNLAAAGRASPRRAPSPHLRTNPCGEILLRADEGQFCNLSEVVVRPRDGVGRLRDKITAATWLGAIQGCLTEFPVLRPSFRAACERERLLGVSLTGQMDNPDVLTPENLEALRDHARAECARACAALEIPMSAAITAGKPSGTVSELVDCASGAHPRFARQYLRRYRVSADDPLAAVLRDSGVPLQPEVGQDPQAPAAWVVSFPRRAPVGAVVREQLSAVDHLRWYLRLRRHWCEHNQSITVQVRDQEWPEVGRWVFEHFDALIGVTFLPYDGGHYALAPYQEIDRATFEAHAQHMPAIDYAQLGRERADAMASFPPACGDERCPT